MKIALLGAGAVGGYFIWGFENADMTGKTLTVIAEGDRLARIRDNGIKVNDKLYHPAVKTPEDAGVQDVVIVALKSTSLKDAVSMLRPLTGPDTVILSMLNGADSEEIIADEVGAEHVLHSIILIASRKENDGIVFDTSYNTTVKYGAVNISDAEKKLATVEAAFSNTPINAVKSPDAMYDIWSKYAKNICNNLPQAVLKVPAALYTRSEHGMFIANKLWGEVRMLAKLRGVTLPEETEIYGCAESSKYSTLQDIEAGRKTEVDSLCGYLIKLAKENDLQVPYIEYTYHAIKALEEKNEGVFD